LHEPTADRRRDHESSTRAALTERDLLERSHAKHERLAHGSRQKALEMRFDSGHRSDDVIDRRGEGGGSPVGAGGGLGILLWLFSRFGLPGVLVGGAILAALYFMSPGASSDGQGGDGRGAVGAPQGQSQANDEQAAFVGSVLDDVQSTWRDIFAQRGARYTPAKLVLFTGSTRSGCGYGSAEVGPFYCPADQRAYIDLSFYRELDRRFGAPGDFAQAYVIAHEIGHHVQHLLGIDDKAQRMAQGSGQKNAVSVRQELQADCFAGVWAHSSNQRKVLEPGDIEEGLRAAAAIGDDALQKQAQGEVRPESWTHGSSEQRVTWFRRGFQSGSMDSCDTFAAR
jgi:predicted metalloprotease